MEVNSVSYPLCSKLPYRDLRIKIIIVTSATGPLIASAPERISVLKDDVIWYLLRWPQILFLETRLRIITTLIMCAIFSAHLTLLGFVQLFVNFNVDYWMNHFLATFGSLIMIVSYATLVGKMRDFNDMVATFFPKFWPLNENPSNYAVLKKQGTAVKWLTSSTTIILAMTVSCFVPMNEYNYKHMAAFEFFVDHLGRKWGYFAAIPLFFSFFHAGYVIQACACVITYLVLHIKFQLFIVNDSLVKMEKVDWLREDDLMEDRNYQSGIRQELVACIDHYCLLERLANRINAMIFYPILGFVFCGIVGALGVFANLKYSKFDDELALGPLFVGCIGCIIGGSFCIVGQLLEDESEKVFHSTANLPWYLWNNENRKMVMMLLVATKKRFSLSSSGIIILNHRLAITLFNLCYSAGTFLMRI